MKRLSIVAVVLTTAVFLSSAQAQDRASPAASAPPASLPPNPISCLVPTNQTYMAGQPVMVRSYDCPAAQDLTYNSQQRPVFPNKETRAGHFGRVVIVATVASFGTPKSVVVETSSGFQDLDQIAVDMVKKWHFIPGSKNGSPIESKARVPVNFAPL